MKAWVKFSTNLFIKDDVVPSIENEVEFIFAILGWLLNKFERNQFTFHLYPNGNFSLETYPEVIFISAAWNDYELNPEVEHWYFCLEKEDYTNEEAKLHSDQNSSKENFISLCQKVNGFLKDEPEIIDICWTTSITLLEDFKLFAEICPDEN